MLAKLKAFRSKFIWPVPPSGAQHAASYRPDIDGLRALAVLCVVAYHAFPQWVQGGFVGVDVFFVISGYLIASIIFSQLQAGTFSYAAFYASRIRRIFPALCVVLFGCLAFGWLSLLAGEYTQLGAHTAAGAGFASNFILWGESGYFEQAAKSKPLLHLWSLGIEEQFYIMFPLLASLLFGARKQWLGWGLALGALASFAANLWCAAPDALMLFYSPLMRAWELLAGALLAYAHLFTPPAATQARWPKADEALCAVALGCILYAAATYDSEALYPGWRALAPLSGAVILIACGAHSRLVSGLLGNRYAVAVGLVSYPLYLWHWPVLAYVRIMNNVWPPATIRAAAVLASLMLAYLTWRFVEKPLRERKQRSTALMLCTAMLLVGLAGFGTWRFEGFPSRYPKIIQDLTIKTYETEPFWRQHRCFLEKDDEHRRNYPDECSQYANRPSIVLWGDSHAAMLYPGLKKFAQEHGFSLSQYTAAMCPPFIGEPGMSVANCVALNDWVMQTLIEQQPDFLVIGAYWSLYDNVRATAEALKKLPNTKRLLIGPPALWYESLPRAMVNYWNTNPLHNLPPRYMKTGLSPGLEYSNEKARTIAATYGFDFYSPYETFCNAHGCLTRIGNDYKQVTSFDYGHLTPYASEFFIESISGYFLKASAP